MTDLGSVVPLVRILRRRHARRAFPQTAQSAFQLRQRTLWPSAAVGLNIAELGITYHIWCDAAYAGRRQRANVLDSHYRPFQFMDDDPVSGKATSPFGNKYGALVRSICALDHAVDLFLGLRSTIPEKRE